MNKDFKARWSLQSVRVLLCIDEKLESRAKETTLSGTKVLI